MGDAPDSAPGSDGRTVDPEMRRRIPPNLRDSDSAITRSFESDLARGVADQRVRTQERLSSYFAELDRQTGSVEGLGMVSSNYVEVSPELSPVLSENLYNNPALLAEATSLEQLFQLYTTTLEEFAIGPLPLRNPPIYPVYTQQWISENRDGVIRAEINRRLASVSGRRHIELMNYIGTMHQRSSKENLENDLKDLVGRDLALTPTQREQLRDEAMLRLTDAIGIFREAAKAVGTSLTIMAEAKAERLALCIDLFTGFAAPALAKRIAKSASRLTDRISTPAFRNALTEKNISQSITSVRKVVNRALKKNAVRLFGETETGTFLQSLVTSFIGAIQEFRKVGIYELTDEEVAMIVAAYDANQKPSLIDIYKASVKQIVQRFTNQVLPIGEYSELVGDYAAPSRTVVWSDIYWINDAGRQSLALVTSTKSIGGLKSYTRHRFKTWIDEDMMNLALARHTGPVKTLSRSKVHGL